MHPLDFHAVLRLELLNTHGTEIAPRSDVVGENLHRDGLGHNASCPWKVRFLDADGSMPQNARRVPARFGFPGLQQRRSYRGSKTTETTPCSTVRSTMRVWCARRRSMR